MIDPTALQVRVERDGKVGNYAVQCQPLPCIRPDHLAIQHVFRITNDLSHLFQLYPTVALLHQSIIFQQLHHLSIMRRSHSIRSGSTSLFPVSLNLHQ